ncbi:spermidine synthase [Pseudomonas sp. HK3]
MAVIYSKQQGQDSYEVRSAGSSVRLYSNGVLHSQYNPLHPISGAIWDLLVLPGFFLSEPPRHVLVLGLGGGTVVHLIRYFFPLCKITCVEREALHIKMAKRFFKIPKDVRVIHGDAYEVLADMNEKFDWVLDDVFQHASGEPEREVEFDKVFALYKKALTNNAVLSMNTIGLNQLRQLKQTKYGFDHGYVMRHPLYDNAIVSFYNKGRSKSEFFDELLTYNVLDTRRKTCRLQVNMRTL